VTFAVDFHLEARGETTVLRLVHSGFGADESWDDQFDGTTAGWGYFLYNLRCYLEQHRGGARRLIWKRLRLPGERGAIWNFVLSSDAGLLDRAADPGIGRVIDAMLAPGGSPTPGHIEVLSPGRTLALRLPQLGDSLLLVEVESGASDVPVGFWLSVFEAHLVPQMEASFAKAMSIIEKRAIAEPANSTEDGHK
jgi:hypothetical protein